MMGSGQEGMESLGFVRALVELGAAGFDQGWHERNGGNASYRLTDEEAAQARRICPSQGEWCPLGVTVPGAAGELFLVTAAGSYMQELTDDPARGLGLVEISPEGDDYRVLWGFAGNGRPTSELAGHMLIHQARFAATEGASRAIYHAHPTSVIALSKLLPLEPQAFTRTLWQAMTESVMVFPEGLGVVGCLVPGSLELARASAAQMERYPAVVWASHGLLCSGTDPRDAFGRMHAIVKAADIYMYARMANGGDDRFPNPVTDDVLQGIADSLGLKLNPEMMEGAS